MVKAPTDAVIAKAREFGFDRLALAYMISHAVPYKQTPGLFRYRDHILYVEGESVVSIAWADRPLFRTTTLICEDCENDGGFCLSCGSKGFTEKNVLIYHPAMEGGNERTKARNSRWSSRADIRGSVSGSAQARHSR